jgi:hypothetical protein
VFGLGFGASGVLIDIFALAPNRSRSTVTRFLDRFLPAGERRDADYTVYVDSAEPTAVFETPDMLFAFCEAELRARSRGYWINRTAGVPHSAHVYFLSDGGLVLGLSVSAPLTGAARDQPNWDRWLAKLQEFAGSNYGYWTCECPPEDTIGEFMSLAQRLAEPGAAADRGNGDGLPGR